jgi:hypothetical protein
MVKSLQSLNSQPAPIGRWVATTGKIVKGPLGPADQRLQGLDHPPRKVKSDKKT